jgi:hypothetical protein
MEFDTDWKTLGRHRIRLRSAKGFPTRVMRRLADVTRLAIDNNMINRQTTWLRYRDLRYRA